MAIDEEFQVMGSWGEVDNGGEATGDALTAVPKLACMSSIGVLGEHSAFGITTWGGTASCDGRKRTATRDMKQRNGDHTFFGVDTFYPKQQKFP